MIAYSGNSLALLIGNGMWYSFVTHCMHDMQGWMSRCL